MHPWIQAFADGQKADLFSGEALWRDYLAFEWDLQTIEGVEAIGRFSPGQSLKLGEAHQHSEAEWILDFESAAGQCRGLVELQEGKAVRLFTSLEQPHVQAQSSDDLQVLIIGAGQSGLTLGAQLDLLGISYLILEQNDRIGDNWRNRYDSLVPHDPVWMNHFPRLPFPDDWPLFTPKDKMGDWMEHYAEALRLNVRLSTKVLKASCADGWTVKTDNEEFQAPHLVFAVGTSGFARTPKLKGQDMFQGPQMHSSAYRNAKGLEGKQVVVVGANNSAHDIAADLARNGAHPTLVQRSSTHIVPHQVYLENMLGPTYDPKHGRKLEDSDFLSMSAPIRKLERDNNVMWEQKRVELKSYFAAIEATGFRLDFAEDGAGLAGKYRRTASGYYIDVGGSQMVAEGKIAIKSGTEVSHLSEDQIHFDDGDALKADAIIYATGFGSMEEWVARLINPETAQKLGRCWGYGSGYRGVPGPWKGELRNMWKPTAQKGLWFMGGNLAQVRIYSRYLALQFTHEKRTQK